MKDKVTVTADTVPRGSMDVMRAWIDESYRAVAPKKLVATPPAAEGAPAARAQKTATPGKRKAR